MDIFAESFTNGKVVLICPGKDGTADGYDNKYKLLSEEIIRRKLAAVVRISNPTIDITKREINLRKGIEYILNNAFRITGRESIELTIIGVSAGARSTALLSSKYKELKNILLIEPAKPFDNELLKNSLGIYDGKMGIIVGQGSGALGIEVGKVYEKLATNCSYKELKEVKNCDHHFSQADTAKKLNEWIMEKLEFWL